MKPGHVAIVVIAAAGALGHAVLDRDAPRSEATPAPSSAGQARGTAAREAGRHLPRLAVAPPLAASSPSSDADPAPAGSSSKPSRAMEPEEVRHRLDQAFQGERTDPSWTSEALATAQARLAALLPASSTLRSVECRASMCRFETAHQDPEAYRQFLVGAFQDPATRLWNGGGFSTPLADRDADGRVVTVAFLAREGQSLPPVWQEAP